MNTLMIQTLVDCKGRLKGLKNMEVLKDEAPWTVLTIELKKKTRENLRALKREWKILISCASLSWAV